MGDPKAKTYTVGVIGFAHMHVNELVDRFIATGRVGIVACADTIPRTPSTISVEGSRRTNLKRALASPGGPRAYENYQEMLAAKKLDIAILCPENARHAEVAEAAAGHRVHILTEKPMAASLEQALRMASAAERPGSPSWSIGPSPGTRRSGG
jgi:predicted dehydrogenase